MSSLEERILVVNKSWMPVNIKTAFKAVCDVFNGKADIVDENYGLHDFDSWVCNWSDALASAKVSEDRLIRSASCVVVVPEIIRLKEYNDVLRRKVKLSRSALFQRDDNTCQYCGRRLPSSELNVDHVLPSSRGGRSTWENLVLSCVRCNSTKGNRTPSEANMPLLRQPKEPHWSLIKTKHMNSAPKSWEDFLGNMYWNTEIE